MKRIIFCLFILPISTLKAQNVMPANSSNWIGRFSSGWTYYSKENSFAPQMNAVSNTLMLNYRVFGDSNRIAYQFKIDAYEKNGFTTAPDTVNRNQFRNRYMIRQLYAAYGNNYNQVKIGRVIPMVTTVDAYPINGISAENIRLTRSLEASAFGGTINDYYKSSMTGTGYDYGACLNFTKDPIVIGMGFTAEKYYTVSLQKLFLYSEYRPLTFLRISQKMQYGITAGALGYSITSLYYRISKKLNARTTLDYYDRRTNFIPPTDTLALTDKYQYTVKEKNVTLAVNYHVFTGRNGSLDVASTIKQRLGNGNLSYGALQLYYRDYHMFRVNVALTGSYTSNQWLNNVRTGISFNRYFLDNKLDATLSGALNSYAWNFTDSTGAKAKTSSRVLLTAGVDLAYHFSRFFYTSFSFSEEIGDATNVHSALYVRLNYFLR